MKKIKRRYSGKSSEKFWRKVNAIKKSRYQQTAYSLGVVLQNLEDEILTQIEICGRL